MVVISHEEVISSRRVSENDRVQMGRNGNQDPGFTRLVRGIPVWQKQNITIRQLGEMQIFISSKPNHATMDLFQFTQSAKVRDVAEFVKTQRATGQISNSWISTIDSTLASRLVNRELEPLIVVRRSLPEAGNFIDGSHRAIAAYAYHSNLDENIPVIIGEISLAQWMLLFAKGFLRSGLPISQRIDVASERLRSLSTNLSNY